MNTYEALDNLRNQIEDSVAISGCKTKVVVTPSAVKEDGLVIKLSLLKTLPGQPNRAQSRITGGRTIRVRCAVAGTAESMTGLKDATLAIEALDSFLPPATSRNLHDAEGKPIANTRLAVEIDPEDSFIDNPGSTEIQDVEDIRYITITLPGGGDSQ